MAFYQSESVTHQANTATAGCAGIEVAQMFEYVSDGTALVAGDVIELGILPAFNTVSGGALLGTHAGIGDVGIMSGNVGDKNPARTVGTEIFAATTITPAAVKPVVAATAYNIATIEQDRSIGFKVTTGSAPAKGDKIQLLLKYHA